jgi:aspartate racemase
LINEAIHRPFDLSRDLMLRVLLLRLEDQQHILVLVKHHVASDGWSSEIFWQEVTALYEAYASGRSPNLRELPVQYADYAVWQREWFRGEVLETQLSYWRRQLDNLATLQLSTDRPRPAIQNFRGGKQTLILPKSLSEALKALSRKEGVTLFMTLLAAFQTLLYRYTGQEDIAVGSPIAGRNRAEIEGLIGFFVNTLVLRTDVSGNLPFKELLARVREVCLDAYSHQDLPLEKLVEELQPERNLNHNPLFQVTFQLNNSSRRLFKLPDIEVEEMELDSGVAKFDLSFSMSDRGENIAGRMQYNTDLFDETRITRMIGHFKTLLEGVVANPEKRISELPLLTEAEERQLLVEWNQTKRDYPREKCIHEVFEAQVERTPDAVAVVFEDQLLTYRELNTRANQLAHYLKKVGVGSEVLVRICVERSLEMIIGLLGILKAGGAYVPLDPSYPKERLKFMMEDSQATVLLTQQRLVDELSENGRSNIEDREPLSSIFDPQFKLICLDRDREAIEKEGSGNPESETTAESLAYVIYTSGSTGKPKGVEVLHRGVLRLLFGVDYARFDATRTFLHLSPISFDAATFEIWGALLHGSQCILYPGKIPSPKELGELLRKHKVSTLWLTSSLFNAVVDEAPEALSGIRQLLIGGEALSVLHVRKALAQLPETEIINGYGPTESTTFTCCYTIPRQLDGVISIPIGRPVGNTEVYLLDAHLNLVPIGIPGEIYIGGDGLARGYLNRPELTKEKFIVNHFGNDSKSRLYRTGDLARYLADGSLEFLGRNDDQVKIRGYRIELNEIEVTVEQHPSVREAVVIAREDVAGNKRLVVYVIARPVQHLTPQQLRDYLKEKLPEYMIPNVFVFLDSLPLTASGKVDRRALPAPDGSRPELAEAYVAPRNVTEKLLTTIWAEVLKLEEVGIHDNFFELGGHSLLATRVVSRIREVFQIELALRALFETPTVAGLSNRIEAVRCAGDEHQPAIREGAEQTEETIL